MKTKGIEFNKNNLNEVFINTAPFFIHRGESASAVAGKLSMNNTDGYGGKKLIGLFDFDKEGTEKFYCLRKQNNWDNTISGDAQTGIYKKRNQHTCFYALLIPIPQRLNSLISNIKEGIFESFVEIENLLSEEMLLRNNLVETRSIIDKSYYKIKDNKKSIIPNIISDLPKEEFNDFVPLFQIVEKLFKI
ncbi:MAG: hypothetical protein ACEPO8_06815 [Rhodothermaceae bacterium]